MNGDVRHIDPAGPGRKTVALLVVFEEPIDEDIAEALIWEVEEAVQDSDVDDVAGATVEHFNMPTVGELITKHAEIRVQPTLDPDATYEIVRFFQANDMPAEVLETGKTLEEAQAHCQDPETSWSTAESDEAKKRTRDVGPWFDGYRKE